MNMFNFFIKKESFDHIISLGYNCEVAYKFLQFYKFEESSLFNWSYTNTIDDLLYTLNNIDKLGTGNWNLPSPLWECANTHIFFHGKVSMEMYINNSYTNKDLENDRIDLIGRISYLKSKFISILKDDSKKLYIYKIKDSDIDKNKIDNIYNSLLNLGGKNFKLLVIAQQSQKEKFDVNNENYIVRFVKKFADDNHVTHKKYNHTGWNKIYSHIECKYYRKKCTKYKFEHNNKNLNFLKKLIKIMICLVPEQKTRKKLRSKYNV